MISSHGPVSVKLTLAQLSDKAGRLEVAVDLSKASLGIDAISWSRGPAPKTTASFVYEKTEKGGTIRELKITGGDLSINGEIDLGRKGEIAAARFPVVILSDENRFGFTFKQAEDDVTLSVSGRSFDARPLIKSAFGNKDDNSEGSQPSYQVEINLDRVYAHRGEVLTDVTGRIVSRKGVVQQANVQGTFISGNPVVFKIAPAGETRELRVAGRDAGAALRAANLYSKIAGGTLDFEATLNNRSGGTLRKGRLIIAISKCAMRQHSPNLIGKASRRKPDRERRASRSAG